MTVYNNTLVFLRVTQPLRPQPGCAYIQGDTAGCDSSLLVLSRVSLLVVVGAYWKPLSLCVCVSPVLVYFGGRREGESWNWAWVLSTRLARQVGYLELLLKLMFVNAPELPEQTTRALPVR